MTLEEQMLEELKKRYPDWGIDVIPPPEGPSSGALRQPDGSGLIRYVFSENERGRYLEYYSFHRIWGDSHRRIYGPGDVESLETIETISVLTGDSAEDRRRTKQLYERNQRLLDELEAAGLLSDGPVPHSFVINSALATGILDDKADHEE